MSRGLPAKALTLLASWLIRHSAGRSAVKTCGKEASGRPEERRAGGDEVAKSRFHDVLVRKWHMADIKSH